MAARWIPPAASSRGRARRRGYACPSPTPDSWHRQETHVEARHAHVLRAPGAPGAGVDLVHPGVPLRRRHGRSRERARGSVAHRRRADAGAAREPLPRARPRRRPARQRACSSPISGRPRAVPPHAARLPAHLTDEHGLVASRALGRREHRGISCSGSRKGLLGAAGRVGIAAGGGLGGAARGLHRACRWPTPPFQSGRPRDAELPVLFVGLGDGQRRCGAGAVPPTRAPRGR